MSDGFKLDAAISLIPVQSGLLIPIFSRRDRNHPFVHTVNRSNAISFFSPYFDIEQYNVYNFDTEIEKHVGDPSVVVFRFDDDIIYFDDLKLLSNWIQQNEHKLKQYPLLRCGLHRMTTTSMGNMYLALECAAKAFLEEKNRKQWINSEIMLMQQNNSIWSGLDENVPKPHLAELPRGEAQELPYEEDLLSWLANPRNYANADWEELWLYAEERYFLDNVLFEIGFSWLGHVYANRHIELYDHVALAGRLIQYQYIAFQSNPTFIDFLSEVFCDGLEDAVSAGFPFNFHKLAIELSLGAMSVDDQFDFLAAAFALFSNPAIDKSFFVDCLIGLLSQESRNARRGRGIGFKERVRFRAEPEDVLELIEMSINYCPSKMEVLQFLKKKYST
jgi:hypothetical protein